MKTTTFIIIGIVMLTFISSCKKDSTNPITYSNFSQLKVGNYWIYERYNVDSLGNATATGIIDSCYVEKDTLINNISYFKIFRPMVVGENFDYSLVRDSLHYLVNNHGQILFSSQNFTDTFYNYFLTTSISDTLCEVIVKMDDKYVTTNTPAGQFQTYNFKQTFKMYPDWASNGNPRYIDTRYAENVGIVLETLPFFAGTPTYTQRRLVKYKTN